jgi:hypothetical protein
LVRFHLDTFHCSNTTEFHPFDFDANIELLLLFIKLRFYSDERRMMFVQNIIIWEDYTIHVQHARQLFGEMTFSEPLESQKSLPTGEVVLR